MLQLKNITKTYVAGEMKVRALSDVSVNFRESEFVAVLGQSGSGKTTLLNIIGGLDRYTSGQLIINGTPTDRYRDADWDTYRNHSIGFVFQSYNLIPHQTVLANVELALTLSGVSKSERRRRAAEALGKVGLSDQMSKKPSQLSGGQMQRVAIARAIVNEPDILLADEPTGALDSETSVQIMEILKEISRDRLIIMVTHNPDLAKKYATRTVYLKDGKITGDSDPYTDDMIPTPDVKTDEKTKKKKVKIEHGVKKGKKSMSIFTALSLSVKNLGTKRGRTFMTSFAGSIGIIGIALIMALSNGIQLYINRVQEDTLSTYPITIQKETTDLSSVISTLSESRENRSADHDLDAVYENRIMYDLMNSMVNIETSKNNLALFKKYLDKEMNKETSTTGLYDIATVKYSYDLPMNVYTTDPDGNVIRSDYSALLGEMMSTIGVSGSAASMYSNFGIMSTQSKVWTELLEGQNGELVSDLLYEQYDVLKGRWPENYNEIVVVVNSRNEISDVSLYALGLKTSEELISVMNEYIEGNPNEDSVQSWSYDEVLGKTFRVVLSPDMYLPGNGEYTDLTETEIGLETLYRTSDIELKVVGIVRQNENAVAGMIGGTIGYTSALTQKIISDTAESELVKAQLENKDTDVLTGLKFKTENEKELTDEEKKAAVDEYIASLSEEEKAELYIEIMSHPSDEYVQKAIDRFIGSASREVIEQRLLEQYPQYEKMIKEMDDETLIGYVASMMVAQIKNSYATQVRQTLGAAPPAQLAALLDKAELSDSQYAFVYDEMISKNVSESTYDENLEKLGYVTLDSPSEINIYASTFSDKDKIADFIAKYNDAADENDKISYTDYVKLLMSSITTIIDVISYVLIAFVAISLVVSSIMIGIITYISVLERTKEIGILRSVGASKRDVSRVFNAETLTIGFFSGIIGIGATLLLCIPVNAIIRALSGISNIGAQLPVVGAVVLVAISMLLTFIAGLIPSRVAANKDPVAALRTE